MSLPKCTLTKYCGKVAFLIKKNSQNSLEHDLLVCDKCTTTFYASEQAVQVPEFETVLECLKIAEFCLVEIEDFRRSYELDAFWMKLIPELQAFEGHIKMIKETLQITKNARNWEDLGYIHDEAKDLFNSILESKLMKEYIRQKNCHKFRDNTSKPDQIPTLSDEWLIKKFLWLKNHTQSSDEINRLIAKIRSKEDIIMPHKAKKNQKNYLNGIFSKSLSC